MRRYLFQDGDDPVGAPGNPWILGDTVLLERFIPGRELTVAVLDGQSLGVTEIRPAEGWYDYAAKYRSGGSQHLVPAPIPGPVASRCRHYAEEAHRALGCRGVSRTDFRWNEKEDDLRILEINTQPGMTPTSLLPEQAAAAGIEFPELCERLVRIALRAPSGRRPQPSA